jgi:hypothetical protein
MKDPGQEAAHPMQRTHLPLSIFLFFASAQFMGHTRSQMPQETQPLLSISNPKTDTEDANPITMPAGHQSQKRLPLAHENISIARNTGTNRIETVSARAAAANETTPRPKFPMGSVKTNSGETANIIPAAANTTTR